jgi:hypothetical protein
VAFLAESRIRLEERLLELPADCTTTQAANPTDDTPAGKIDLLVDN